MGVTVLRNELLTVSEAARRARVNVDTIRRWIAEGTLPAVRVNSRVIRISTKDLDALLTPTRGEQLKGASRK